MRWWIPPAFDLEKVTLTRCLLGAGTLGCYVARTLMARTPLSQCPAHPAHCSGLGRPYDHVRRLLQRHCRTNRHESISAHVQLRKDPRFFSEVPLLLYTQQNVHYHAPGFAAIATATAVKLFVSLLQHLHGRVRSLLAPTYLFNAYSTLLQFPPLPPAQPQVDN